MDILGAFLIGLTSAFVGAISTGANMISVPGLIFMGASPITAIATTRLSALTGGLAAIYRYQKDKDVLWVTVPFFMCAAIAAGLLGPRLVLSLSPERIQPIIGVLLLAMLPLLFFQPKFGEAQRETTPVRNIIGLFVIFIIMLYGTAFGVGGGIFLLYALVYFYGMTVIEANATGHVIWFLGAVTALVAFLYHGQVDFHLGIPLMIGAGIGGYLGARFAIRKGTHWVKVALTIVILISGTKLIFF